MFRFVERKIPRGGFSLKGSGRKSCSPIQVHLVLKLILYRHGEICSGIVCGCMPTLPQFFRHFIPKLRSRLSLGKSSKVSSGSSQRQIERKRKQSVQPHLDTEVYMELDDEVQLKATEDKGLGPMVWTDEVPRDEEKALPPRP